MVSIQLRFDLRVPPLAGAAFAPRYHTMLEMCDWADQVGVQTVLFSEHHGDVGGWTPAPLTLAAAVLARTTNVHVGVAALVAPLHHPIRIAEQLVAIECLAPGRLWVVLGAGYRRSEFEMVGVDRSFRGPLLDECAMVLKGTWTGQPFEFRGQTIRVTPAPDAVGEPPIKIGGKSEFAARRAARFGLPFAPSGGDEDTVNAIYFAESARLGFNAPVIDYSMRRMAHCIVAISEDHDATWRAISAGAVFDAETYAAMQDDAAQSEFVNDGAISAASLRAGDNYCVLTPDECISRARSSGWLSLHPLMAGVPPTIAWRTLELLEHAVLPQLRLRP